MCFCVRGSMSVMAIHRMLMVRMSAVAFVATFAFFVELQQSQMRSCSPAPTVATFWPHGLPVMQRMRSSWPLLVEVVIRTSCYQTNLKLLDKRELGILPQGKGIRGKPAGGNNLAVLLIPQNARHLAACVKLERFLSIGNIPQFDAFVGRPTPARQECILPRAPG